MAGRFHVFFGDDWDEALDSLKSAPGALAGIVISVSRQMRPLDAAAFAAVLAGWLWLLAGYLVSGDHDLVLALVALAPIALWLVAGITGALVFEISGLGPRILGYWESYVILVLLTLFGVVSLRLALNPRDLMVHRGVPPAAQTINPA